MSLSACGRRGPMSVIKLKGFSLIELMLALLLGTVVLTLMGRHYLNSKHQSNDTVKLLARAYDQQLISQLIHTSIRQAGFTPCGSVRGLNLDNEQRTSPLLQPVMVNVGDKKALQISRMSERFSIVKEALSKKQFQVETGIEFKSNERVLIADCFHAEMAKIKWTSHENQSWRITLEKALHYGYESPIYIGEWLEERFFIDKNSQGQPALYYSQQHPEELSRQIHAMTVSLKNASSNNKVLVNIDFLLEQGEVWHLDVAVRA